MYNRNSSLTPTPSNLLVYVWWFEYGTGISVTHLWRIYKRHGFCSEYRVNKDIISDLLCHPPSNQANISRDYHCLFHYLQTFTSNNSFYKKIYIIITFIISLKYHHFSEISSFHFHPMRQATCFRKIWRNAKNATVNNSLIKICWN